MPEALGVISGQAKGPRATAPIVKSESHNQERDNSPLSPHRPSLTIQQGQTRESREAVHPRFPGFQVRRIKAG